MREGKLKIEPERTILLANLEDWTFPPTDWEHKTVAEIKTLQTVRAHRPPNASLMRMKMVPQQCHVNASEAERNDPQNIIKHITGWFLELDCYVLHSIIIRDGQYICVTPTLFDDGASFTFVPDPKIVWQNEGNCRVAYRDAVAIGKGVRIDPERTILEINLIKERVISGVNPYKAFKITR